MDPRWTPRERILFAALLAAALGWNAFVLLTSPGCSLDDELTHYLRSRSVWENPALVFDAWTRIGRNLFHVLPAHFGLTVTRLWTLAFAGLGIVLTTRFAAVLGAPRTWLIPLLIGFQPWFVELSWGVLTQTPFLLALVGGVLALASNRLLLSGLCFGALPLVRHEGLALTALWAAAVFVRTLFQRDIPWSRVITAFVLAALPLVAANTASWIAMGDLPARVFAITKPTEIYGHGPLWHFIPISILPAGVFTLILAGVGCPTLLRDWRRTWPLGFFAAYFALHSVIYWQGLFASGGYYHFLMPMAPGLAVAALFGADRLLASPSRPHRLAVALLIGTGLQGLLLVHLWRDGRPHLRLERDPLAATLDEAIEWQHNLQPPPSTVICRNVYVAWREDWIETPARRALDDKPPDQLPLGTILIWDEKYAPLAGFPLAAVTSDPAWTTRATFGHGSVRIFEKIR